MPLLDSVHCRYLFPIPYDDILRGARGIRRACLDALQDQTSRFSTQSLSPVLPLPRFSVKFCPFALQLQKDQRTGSYNRVQARKFIPYDRYDDREICPCCNAHISVSAHSGLPQHRRMLFQSHALPSSQSQDTLNRRATFACTSCYKTFDDSYAFLEHAFQKETGSEQSCLRRYSTRFSLEKGFFECKPALVEQCLKNCLDREMLRAKRARAAKEILKM